MDYTWVIFLLVMLTYFDIKSSLKKILNNQIKDTKKDFSLLEKLKGKEVQIEVEDDDLVSFTHQQKGILKDFNDTWLILEKNTKKGKELNYYRIINIQGVVEVKE